MRGHDSVNPSAPSDPSQSRVDCLGVPVARTDWEPVREWFFDAIERRDARSMYFVNAHTLNLGWADPEFRDILARGDLVLNDGSGLAIYARLARERFDYNFNGTDLLPRLFDAADPERPLRVFLYGAVPGRAVIAAQNIATRYPGVEVVGIVDGFAREGVVEQINAASPDVLLVGMGNPLQERWIDRHRAGLNVGVVTGIGALIDFLSGVTVRAPLWIRNAGMEWVFRLGLEPRRMWHRYVVGNPAFLVRSAAYLGGLARPQPTEAVVNPSGSPGPTMRIAYLTTAYPSVSHTFIRRELLELERTTGEVARFAIRDSPHDLVDPDDQREDAKTWRVLKQQPLRWAKALATKGLIRPLQAARGLRKATQLGYRSERGLPRHVIYFAEALLLLDEMSQRGIDHVHVHFGTNPAAVAQIMRAMGGPTYSFTVHGPDELDAPKGLSLGSKITDSAFVVAITDFCAGQLRRWVTHDHWHKIKVVHCTVGDEFFTQAAPVDPASKALVCVGRLSAQKGQLLLVEAFADAIDAGVDAQLVLAGDGEMRGEIEALVARRNLGDRVRITGWISGAQVRAEILAARALVLPSFAEGLPMVIMEAFALGRPVLTTYIAGIPELVVDGDNGWLIPSGSAPRIRDAIATVMNTPVATLDAMGARGREAVRRLHYTPTETAKLADEIRRVVAESR